jgi:hypothetical protein
MVQFLSFKDFSGISPGKIPVFQFLLECPSMSLMTLAHNLILKNPVMKTYTKMYIGKVTSRIIISKFMRTLGNFRVSLTHKIHPYEKAI